MSKVTIYTKIGCPYCAAAKKHFSNLGVTIEEIDVQEVAGAKEKANELTGGENIVPVIVEDGRVTVGFGGG